MIYLLKSVEIHIKTNKIQLKSIKSVISMTVFFYTSSEVIIILDWIFEGIVKWIASLVTSVMDAISGIFLNALGTDMVAMEQYFPFITKAFEIMQYTAWCILFLITIWQLFKTFSGPISEAENPWHLLARSTLFAFLIGYAKPIFTIVLDIAKAPYTALMEVAMNASDFTFAGIEQTLKNGLATFVAIISIVGLLLIIIMMFILGWNYFKTLLMTVERYVIVGILCYTSPLAFAMGGSKATSKVFQSWCRMVGSQLLLLVMNVWFLRAFNSSVGQFTINGGALTTGEGNIFLWLFCALAFLKTAQKFDSILASLGLNIAQTGGNMGMELLMATRVLGGFGGKMSRTAGSAFGGSAGSAGTTSAMGGGAMSGFASKFKGNSYVRDAVVSGGTRMGAGGGVGVVGRAFGGMAAKTGTTLTGESISSVAARHPSVSGNIGGNIADRSLGNYMPHMSGRKLNGTQITGGHISTTATGTNGKEANVQMYNSDLYERPDTPHSVVNASDGSSWYQTAAGAGMSEFYSPPSFTGDVSESAQVAESFPDAENGTMLRTVDDGVIEATNPDGSNSIWYNSALYEEPNAPHSTISSADGVNWYAMQPNAETPYFETGEISSGNIADSANGINETPTPQENINTRVSSDTSENGVITNNAGGAMLNGNVPDISDIRDSSTLTDTPAKPIKSDSSVGSDKINNINDATIDGNIPKISDMSDKTTLSGGSVQSIGSSVSGSEVSVPETFNINETAAISTGINQDAISDSSAHMDSAKIVDGSSGITINGNENDTTELNETSTLTGNAGTGLNETNYGDKTDISDSVGVMAHNLGNYNDSIEPQTPSASLSGGVQPGVPQINYDPVAAAAYNQAQFHQFMPGYEQQISSINAARQSDGILEIRHPNGTGTAFYDNTMYKTPRGDYKIYEDNKGGKWYAVDGTPTVERRPVYEDGKPVFDGDEMKTVNVEGMKYKTIPEKFNEPKKRDSNAGKAPRKKQ